LFSTTRFTFLAFVAAAALAPGSQTVAQALPPDLAIEDKVVRTNATDDAHAGYEAGIREDYSAAVILLTRAIDSRALPTRALVSALINRGVSYRRQGRIHEAVGDYSSALQIEPSNIVAIANRGLAFAKSRQYTEAIRDLTDALKLDPKNSKILLERGNAFFDKGDYRSAIEDYDQALELDPGLQVASINRKDAYDRLALPDQACTCDTAIELPRQQKERN
jgi:tetratricopeptide (TPR) repeat protein